MIFITKEIQKEDLERYYIDEEKSMSEISRIYGCWVDTIKRKLKKYGIPIRPNGAFLVDNDGKTLNSKRNKGEVSSIEYNKEFAKNKGYENWSDYNNELAKNKGYENNSEYSRKMRHERGLGTGLSMNKNKNCSDYLGVHICENKEFLSKIINIIECMPNGNPGYDVICIKDKRVDVKCSCLVCNKEYIFHTKKNKVADYFLMISFDNREYLNVQHIWLVKGDAVIEKTSAYNSKEFIVNEKDVISIGKGNKALKRWKKHEITDSYKLKEVQKVCDNFKNNNNYENC